MRPSSQGFSQPANLPWHWWVIFAPNDISCHCM